MSLGTAHVIRANARDLPLADNTVDLVVTSPPYFALRSYQDGGEHYAGQIGDEPTPAEFVDSLLEVTRECVRVLKPSGSLWVNLGDKYAGSAIPKGVTRGYDERTCPSCGRVFTSGRNKCHKCGVSTRMAKGRRGFDGPTEYVKGAPAKSLIGIPWRYALRCIDDLGLILRAEVIWSKPNGLPESVTDRVRRSHETWFHFTLNPRYFSAVDETEPLRVPDHLGVDHFAAFPTEWPKRIIAGWSPAGVCVECGEGRRPVVGYDGPHELAPQRVLSERERWRFRDVFREACSARGVTSKHLDDLLGTNGMGTQYLTHPNQVAVPTPEKWSQIVAEFGHAPWLAWKLPPRTGISSVLWDDLLSLGREARKSGGTGAKQFHHKEPPARSVTGYSCACPEPTAPTTPGVVLDPFGGTGTTAMVAKALGRTGISVDMSADYCRLAEWRCNDRDQLAKVLGLSKSDPIHDDEQSLLDLIEGGAHGCPVCDRQRQATADVPPVRLRAASETRRWFEAAMAERWLAT